MRRSPLPLVALAVCSALALAPPRAATGPAPNSLKDSEGRETIPDPTWVGEPGDRVTINGFDALGYATVAVQRATEKFRDAKDWVGLQPMLDRKDLFKIPRGTGILVVKRHTFRGPQSSQVSSGGSDTNSSIQAQILSQPAGPPVMLEVRVLDGDLKDRLVFVLEEDAARMIPKPESSHAKKRKAMPPEKPIDPSARAAALLKSAQALEKSGKVGGAISMYRQLLKDYPSSPSAKDAAARIEALSGK